MTTENATESQLPKGYRKIQESDLKPSDVAAGEIGIDGGPVGYLANGDKVELVFRDGEPWLRLIRRNDNDIAKGLDELLDKFWWNHHQMWLEQIGSGEADLTPEQVLILAEARRHARALEHKYGKENLRLNDFQWGMLNGKLSALRWVRGNEWDEHLSGR